MKNQQSFVTVWQKFATRWLVYQAEDSATARKGYILSALTLFFSAASVLFLAFLTIDAGMINFNSLITFSPLIFVGLYWLTRRGYLNPVGVAMIVLLALLSTFPIGDLTSLDEPGFLVLALDIILAGLLIGNRGMFITAFLVGIVATISYIFQDGKLSGYSFSLLVIYFVLAVVTYLLLQEGQQALRQSRSYARELERSRDNLENEVAARTQTLQTAFDLVNQVGQVIINSTSAETLLAEVRRLIQTRFEDYQVRLFIIEGPQNDLISLSAAGMANDETTGKLSRYRWGEGLVGRAAADGETIIRQATSAQTGQELATPLRQEDRVMGVMLVHNQTGLFSETDVQFLQVLASQMAVALSNSHLVDEIKEALDRAEALNSRLVQGRWEQTLNQQAVTGYAYTPEGSYPLDKREAIDLDALVDHYQDSEKTVVMASDGSTQGHDLAVPVMLRGEPIGFLGLERDEDQPWNNDDELIARTIAEQIGLALESARLFEETGRQAAREKIIGDITRQVWASGDLEHVMQSAVAQLGETLAASKVVIRLGTEETLLQSRSVS